MTNEKREFVLVHLAHHLIGAGREDQLIELLTSGPDWQIAKRMDGERGSSYLRDVDAVLGRIFNLPRAYSLRDSFVLLAARSSAHLGFDLFPDAEVDFLLLLGRDKEVLSIASLTPDASQRFDTLLSLTKSSPDATWKLALAAALDIRQDWIRGKALVDLAEALGDCARPNLALKVLETALPHAVAISNVGNRSQELLRSVRVFISCDDIECALRTVDHIQMLGNRVAAIAATASKLISTGEVDRAGKLIRDAELLTGQGKVTDPHTFVAIAEVLLACGQRDQALKEFRNALKAIYKYPDWEDRRDLHLGIVVALTKCGFIEQAREIAQSKEAEREVVTTLADLGQTEDALTILNQMGPSPERDKAVVRVMAALVSEGNRVEAVNRMTEIRDPFWRVRGFLELVHSSPATDWNQAKSQIGAIENSDSRSYAWRLLARSRSQDGNSRDAAESYREAVAAAGRGIHSLHETAKMMAADGFGPEALAVARSIDDPFIRGHALRDIAFEFGKQGKKIEASAVYDQALAELAENEKKWNTRNDVAALRSLGKWLAAGGHHALAQKVFMESGACADQIPGDPSSRAVEISHIFEDLHSLGYSEVMYSLAELVSLAPEDYYRTRWTISLQEAISVARLRSQAEAAQRLRLAEEQIGSFEEQKRPEAMVSLLNALLECGLEEWATHVLETTANIILDEGSQIESRGSVAGWLIRALGGHDRVDKAAQFASRLTDDYALAELVICLGRARRYLEGRNILGRITGYWHDEACRQVAEAAFESDADAEAEVWIAQIEDNSVVATAWTAAAERCLQKGRLATGNAAAIRARQLAQSLHDDLHRKVLARLSIAFGDVGDLAMAADYGNEAERTKLDPNRLNSDAERQDRGLLADVLMAQGKFNESLQQYQDEGLHLLHRVLRNSRRLERCEQGVTTTIIRDLTRVFGWNSRVWLKVHSWLTEMSAGTLELNTTILD